MRKTVQATCWKAEPTGSAPAPIPGRPWRPPIALQTPPPQKYPQWKECQDAASVLAPPPRSVPERALRLPTPLSSEGKVVCHLHGRNEGTGAPAPHHHPTGDAPQNSNETPQQAPPLPIHTEPQQEDQGPVRPDRRCRGKKHSRTNAKDCGHRRYVSPKPPGAQAQEPMQTTVASRDSSSTLGLSPANRLSDVPTLGTSC
mmetsp:Transcript_11509/g.25486  ORF Transcript_11509/g.25486 Transcript_11509/m.25486 type:complete len:200 (+) Transcript_11509:85-684(+)